MSRPTATCHKHGRMRRTDASRATRLGSCRVQIRIQLEPRRWSEGLAGRARQLGGAGLEEASDSRGSETVHGHGTGKRAHAYRWTVWGGSRGYHETMGHEAE
jgi:hypothetical protein